MPLFRDLAGKLIRPAQVERTLTETFINAAALPSWLSATAGTASFGSLATSRGHFTLTSGAVSGNSATLKSSFDINLAHQTAVLWEVEGFRASADTVDIIIGVAGASSQGAFARQQSNETTVRTLMSGVSVTHDYNLRADGEYGRKRNLAALLIRESRELFVMEDGQVMAYRQGASLNTGLVRPELTVTTKTAAAANFEIGLARLTLFHP